MVRVSYSRKDILFLRGLVKREQKANKLLDQKLFLDSLENKLNYNLKVWE